MTQLDPRRHSLGTGLSALAVPENAAPMAASMKTA